ncbi:Gfo/Idh/MocA family oxidoreductase [Marispirochaeta sp.]|uniref:Gfo/Idh/MocA family protein n=1 Tax=Marispirochaeta sp. TaxID=2038653 RepID=UPI0029C7DF08|nr:Gfo/Idh/MocA family oxidoreductase [Marispirochaeta sp.]
MIKVAIIGLGNISRLHIQAYIKFPERCKIVALVDIDLKKTQAYNDEFNLQAKLFSDLQTLIDREKVDLVSICTPPFTHKDITITCLKAGIHVLCEKPMASSLAECDEMLAAQKVSGALLSIVSNNRFRTPIMALKRILDSEVAGPVVHAQADSFWWRGLVYYDLWWRGTWEKEGGGCTLNHGVHHIDLFQWMMGMPASVSSVIVNLMHSNAEVEDYSLAIFNYSSGSIGTVSCSVVHHGEEQKMIFQCEKARISFPWNVYASDSMPNGFPVKNKALEKQLNELYSAFPPLEHEMHEGQIDDVLKAIQNGTSPLVDGTEGRKTLELISAIYQSGVSNSPVQFPMTKDQPFYTREGILKNAIRFHRKTGATEFKASPGVV